MRAVYAAPERRPMSPGFRGAAGNRTEGATTDLARRPCRLCGLWRFPVACASNCFRRSRSLARSAGRSSAGVASRSRLKTFRSALARSRVARSIRARSASSAWSTGELCPRSRPRSGRARWRRPDSHPRAPRNRRAPSRCRIQHRVLRLARSLGESIDGAPHRGHVLSGLGGDQLDVLLGPLFRDFRVPLNRRFVLRREVAECLFAGRFASPQPARNSAADTRKPEPKIAA